MILLYFIPLRALTALSLHGDKYSQILLIPFISLFFLFLERRSIKIAPNFSIIPGVILCGSGLLVLIASRFLDLAIYPIVNLDFSILSFVLILTGGTFFFFGLSLFSSNKFPWLLLLLLIPVPSKVLGFVITFFQYGSAEVVNLLFQLTGMTFIRDQLTFHVPSISIHIAKECSGIRSSTALVITALLAGQLFLKTIPGKTILLLFVIPLTLLKNGIRITTLTILADKVDTSWLTHSDLHHNGGIVFFGCILVLLFGIMFAIKKVEDIFQKDRSVARQAASPEPIVANESSDHGGSPSGKK